MNFTKDYIELCKCKEVQELRPDIKCGDYCVNTERNHMFLNTEDYEPGRKEYRNNLIWLPSGDNLDEEIIKICKEKKWDYYSIYDCSNKHYTEIKQTYRVVYSKNDTNPLICKLKLLLQLLNTNL